jgi:HTH-type transcriptional regulator/antitoxin HigA
MESTATNIHPIRSDADLTAALEEIEGLWGAEPGSPEGDRLDVLMTLTEHFEASHYPTPQVHPVDYLKAAMEARGATAKDLAGILGSQPRASEILNRRRSLTLDQIRKICAAWRLPSDPLIAAYEPA